MKAFVFVMLASALQAATSISQFGITWTFNADHPVGQYANGDYYVVAPAGLTITGITPASTISAGRTINGTMLNPVAGEWVSQGFASDISGYSAGLNVARPGGSDLSGGNPLVVAPSSSLVSAKSHATAGNRPGLNDVAVLTVVATEPPAGAFRPPYVGTDKTHNWNKSELDYGKLRDLAPVAGSPAPADVSGSFVRPWIEIVTSHGGRYIHPANNQPDYGGDMATMIGSAMLVLHLDYSDAEKETLFVRLVQYGLDVYGAAKSGGNWRANGGHNLGRKMPMILAGLALNDSNILAYANAANYKIFQEDQQTFVVDAAQLLVVPYTGDGRTRLPYTSDMLGVYEWGEKHDAQKTRDGSNWGAYYRNICYRAFVRHVLVAHLTTGAVAAWNWAPFFNYVDRAKGIALPSEFGTFVHGMWVAYRAPTAVTPIDAPAGLTATARGNRGIALAWTPPPSNADTQTIERNDGGGWVELVTRGSALSAYIDKSVFAGTAYSYRIIARNDVDTSAYSSTASATTAAPAPSPRRARGGF